MVHALKCQVHANRSLQVSIIRWHMQHSKRRICSMSHIFGKMRSKHRTFWRTTANPIILALLSSLYSQHTFWVYLGVDGNIQRQFVFIMLNVKENCLLLKLLSQTQKNVSEPQTGIEPATASDLRWDQVAVSIPVWGSETFFWACDKSLSSKQFSFNSPSCKSSSYIYIYIYVKWSYNAELFRLNIYTVINATWLDLKQYFLFGVPDTKPLHFYIMVSLIQIVYFLTLSHPEAL